jgi:serine/threonine-protein kinase
VKVIDLGQSCRIGTIKQRIQGTPDFIAPEQVHRRPLDSRTDVYNFGAALYWTVTGKAIPTVLPRERATNLKSDYVVTPPEKVNERVSAPLSKLIIDCVEMAPADRPESMSTVAARLGLIAHSLTRQSNGGQ